MNTTTNTTPITATLERTVSIDRTRYLYSVTMRDHETGSAVVHTDGTEPDIHAVAADLGWTIDGPLWRYPDRTVARLYRAAQ